MAADIGASWRTFPPEHHVPPIVQNPIQDIPHTSLKIWPFYHIPRLETWTSARVVGGYGRMAVLGDSAHTPCRLMRDKE